MCPNVSHVEHGILAFNVTSTKALAESARRGVLVTCPANDSNLVWLYRVITSLVVLQSVDSTLQ